MNKTKKGLLTAGSILTIIASVFAIVGSICLFWLSSIVTEDMLKESYLSDTTYTYHEEVDGSYYFTGIEEGVEVIVNEQDIELLAEFTSLMFVFFGVVSLGVSIAKVILAIKILVMNGKDKYAKGTTIALLVLSALNTNLIELTLFIIAMCQKDKVQIVESNSSDVILEDVK